MSNIMTVSTGTRAALHHTNQAIINDLKQEIQLQEQLLRASQGKSPYTAAQSKKGGIAALANQGGPQINWSGADTEVLKKVRSEIRLVDKKEAKLKGLDGKGLKSLIKDSADIQGLVSDIASGNINPRGIKQAVSATGNFLGIGGKGFEKGLGKVMDFIPHIWIAKQIADNVVVPMLEKYINRDKEQRDKIIEQGKRSDIFFKTGITSDLQKQMEGIDIHLTGKFAQKLVDVKDEEERTKIKDEEKKYNRDKMIEVMMREMQAGTARSVAISMAGKGASEEAIRDAQNRELFVRLPDLVRAEMAKIEKEKALEKEKQKMIDANTSLPVIWKQNIEHLREVSQNNLKKTTSWSNY